MGARGTRPSRTRRRRTDRCSGSATWRGRTVGRVMPTARAILVSGAGRVGCARPSRDPSCGTSSAPLEARDVCPPGLDLRAQTVGRLLFELPRKRFGFVEHCACLLVRGLWVSVLCVLHELVGALDELPYRRRIALHAGMLARASMGKVSHG